MTHLILFLLLLRLLLRLALGLFSLGLCIGGCSGTSFRLLLRLASCLLLFLDPLNTGIQAESKVNDATETGRIFLLAASTLGLILLLRVTLVIAATHEENASISIEIDDLCELNLLVATLINFLVQIFETPPAVKVVPEVVEPLYRLLRVFPRSEQWHGLFLTEPGLPLEHGTKLPEECLLGVLRVLDVRGRGYIGGKGFEFRVDGIELTTLFRVGEDLHGFLDTFKEGIVISGGRMAGFFVGMMFENLLAVYKAEFVLEEHS